MYFLAAFIFGTIAGSFLNVCIVRMPKEESIVSPGSHCQFCQKPVRWYDNIPCVSFFLLKGRCRDCGAVIAPRYVLVELAAGFLAVLFYTVFGCSIKGVAYFSLSLALLAGSLIDLKYRIIPDGITLFGILAGLILSSFFPALQDRIGWKAALMASLWGVIVGGGFLYVTASLVEFVVKKEAMGGGDVKLLGMIGAFLGWEGALWTIFVSSITGSVIGLYYRIAKGEPTVAYGPHIAFAAFLYLFFGHEVMRQYMNSFAMIFSGS